MNVERRDEIDHAIDQALREVTLGEPRRVTAATVRAALGPRRRASVPVWFAAAAALLVGVLLILRLTAREEPPRTPPIARSIDLSPAPIQTAPIVAEPKSIVAHRSPRRALSATPLIASESSEPAYEGLPRLAIASLEPPAPLLTGRLEASGLVIPNLEIAPLSVSTLFAEPDNKQ